MFNEASDFGSGDPDSTAQSDVAYLPTSDPSSNGMDRDGEVDSGLFDGAESAAR